MPRKKKKRQRGTPMQLEFNITATKPVRQKKRGRNETGPTTPVTDSDEDYGIPAEIPVSAIQYNPHRGRRRKSPPKTISKSELLGLDRPKPFPSEPAIAGQSKLSFSKPEPIPAEPVSSKSNPKSHIEPPKSTLTKPDSFYQSIPAEPNPIRTTTAKNNYSKPKTRKSASKHSLPSKASENTELPAPAKPKSHSSPASKQSKSKSQSRSRSKLSEASFKDSRSVESPKGKVTSDEDSAGAATRKQRRKDKKRKKRKSSRQSENSDDEAYHGDDEALEAKKSKRKKYNKKHSGQEPLHHSESVQPKAGDWVELRYHQGDNTYEGEILAETATGFEVLFYGWADSEEVPKDYVLRVLPPKEKYFKGDAVLVTYEGEEVKALIVKEIDAGEAVVKYYNYDQRERVALSRIVKKLRPDEIPEPDSFSAQVCDESDFEQKSDYEIGTEVYAMYSDGKLYEAVVEEKKGDAFRVRYKDYEEETGEFLKPNQIYVLKEQHRGPSRESFSYETGSEDESLGPEELIEHFNRSLEAMEAGPERDRIAAMVANLSALHDAATSFAADMREVDAVLARSPEEAFPQASSPAMPTPPAAQPLSPPS